MLDTQFSNDAQPTILAQVTLIPLKGDDFETLSRVEDVQMEVWDNISAQPNYTLKMASNDTRGAGAILILGEVAHEVIAQKDFVIAAFQAVASVVRVLTKHKYVKKIELKMDGDCISIEDADQVTVQRLLNIFVSKHSESLNKTDLLSPIEVLGTVTKGEISD